MGELPVTDDWRLMALDAPNSSEQGNRENQYGGGLSLNYSKSLADNNGYMYSYISFTKQFRRKHMFYDSDALHTTMSRNYSYPKVNFNFHYSFDKNHKTIGLYGSNNISLPNIGQLADITQTNNPLYIRKGNPDLKPQTYWWMNANYRSDGFAAILSGAFLAMAEEDGPTLIHCVEGKDRTGFACALLLALADATEQEIIDDYMITYANYYRITKESDARKYEAILVNVNDFIACLRNTDTGTVSLKLGAELYLQRGGLTADQIAHIEAAITTE